MIIDAEICGIKLGDFHPVRIMGVINLSPESFYEGSIVRNEEDALNRAINMIENGAEMIDLGAASTAPGRKEISIEKEEERLIPVLKKMVKEIDVPISVDTQSSIIAERALKIGASIINDVSGLKKDEKMLDVILNYKCPLIIMASKKRPGDLLTLSEIKNCLEETINLIESKGVDPNDIIIDPGIGRWIQEKTYEYNLEIIKGLSSLKLLRKPILVAISRKSFIDEILNVGPPEKRLYGSLGATAIAVYEGAHIVRTHDVRETLHSIKIAELLRKDPILVENKEKKATLLNWISKKEDIAALMEKIGVGETGIRIMKEKASFRTILIENVTHKEALILKQEILARGGEAAIPEVALRGGNNLSIIIFGTSAQISSLKKKLKKQAFDLPIIASLLDELEDIE
ncbi:MAG: dihydropteroate synthase [Candidatus Hydrothermarchaeota archaeon]